MLELSFLNELLQVSVFSNYFQKLIIVPKYEPKKVIRENYKIDKTKFIKNVQKCKK